MSPIERKKIEDQAKEAGIHDDDIPHIVDIEMKVLLADDSRDQINEVLVIDQIHL